MSAYTYTTQRQLRRAFWLAHPVLYHLHYRKAHGQNDYPADIRTRFVDFIDHLERAGEISQALAQRVTL